MKKSLYLSVLALAWIGFGFCYAESSVPSTTIEHPVTDLTIVSDLPADLTASPESCGVAESQEDMLLMSVTCTTDCGSGSQVTCTGSGECTAVDRDCSNSEPGYVTCGSATNYCPACQCTNGQTRYITGSGCCCDYTIDWRPVNRQKVIKEVCVNGYWVYNSFSCSGQNCGGTCEL